MSDFSVELLEDRRNFVKKFNKSELESMLSAYGHLVDGEKLSNLQSLLLKEWQSNKAVTKKILEYAADGQYYVEKIVNQKLGIVKNNSKNEPRLIKFYIVKWESFPDLSEEPETNDTIEDYIGDYYEKMNTTEAASNRALFSKAFLDIKSFELAINKTEKIPYLKIKMNWKIGNSAQSSVETLESLTKMNIVSFIEAKMDISFGSRLSNLMQKNLLSIADHFYDLTTSKLDFKCKFSRKVCPESRRILEENLVGTDALNQYLSNIGFNSYTSFKDSLQISNKRDAPILEESIKKKRVKLNVVEPALPMSTPSKLAAITNFKIGKILVSAPSTITYASLQKSIKKEPHDEILTPVPTAIKTLKVKSAPKLSEVAVLPKVADQAYADRPVKVQKAPVHVSKLRSAKDEWENIGFKEIALVNFKVIIEFTQDSSFPAYLQSIDNESINTLASLLSKHHPKSPDNLPFSLEFNFLVKNDFFLSLLFKYSTAHNSLSFYSISFNDDPTSIFGNQTLNSVHGIPIMPFSDRYHFGFYINTSRLDPSFIPYIPKSYLQSSNLFLTIKLPHDYNSKEFDCLYGSKELVKVPESKDDMLINIHRRYLFSTVLSDLNKLSNIVIYGDQKQCGILRELVNKKQLGTGDLGNSCNLIIVPENQLILLKSEFKNVVNVHYLRWSKTGFKLTMHKRHGKLVMIHSSVLNQPALRDYLDIEIGSGTEFIMSYKCLDMVENIDTKAYLQKMMISSKIHRCFDEEEVLGMLGWFFQNLEYLELEIVATEKIKELVLLDAVNQTTLQ